MPKKIFLCIFNKKVSKKVVLAPCKNEMRISLKSSAYLGKLSYDTTISLLQGNFIHLETLIYNKLLYSIFTHLGL